MVAVDDDVGVVDEGCAGVVSNDVAVGSGDDELVRVSLWGAVCVTALAVVVEVVWVSASMKLVGGWGTVSVGIPAPLSECGGLSQAAVWVTASAEVVGVVWVPELSWSVISAFFVEVVLSSFGSSI